MATLTEQNGLIEAQARIEQAFQGSIRAELARDVDRSLDAIERLITAVGQLGRKLTPEYRTQMFELTAGSSEAWHPPTLDGAWMLDSLTAWCASGSTGTSQVNVAGIYPATALSFALTAGAVVSVPIQQPLDTPLLALSVTGLTAGAVCIALRLAKYG